MQTQFLWVPGSNTYKISKFHPKKMSYEGDMSFQRSQMDFVNKKVL